MAILLTIFLLLLAPLLLVLFAPLRFRGAIELRLREDAEAEHGYDGYARWQVLLTWGGFLWRMALEGSGTMVLSRRVTVLGILLKGGGRLPRRPANKRPERPKRPRRRHSLQDIRVYAHEGSRLAARLWRLLQIRLRGQIAFGFADPALTGMACAGLATAPVSRGLQILPDFAEPRLEGQVELTGRALGYQIAAAILAALWRKPIRTRLWRRLRAKGG